MSQRKMTPPPPPSINTKFSISELTDDFDLLSTSTSSASLKPYTRTTSSASSASASSSNLNSSSLASSRSGSNGMSGLMYSDDFTLGLKCSAGSIPIGSGGLSSSPQQKSSGIGSRRQSYPSNIHSHPPQHHHHHGNNTSSHHTHHHRHHKSPVSSKERYVFSNFRFLVREGFEYPKTVDDPVDWLSIEMVLVPEIENVLCPICLDVPFVPRFTRCGHIYCLPCLLQFFQTADSCSVSGLGNNWRSCPVCAEPLHLKQLRPIKFCPATEPKEGEIFNSLLVKKSVGSLRIEHPRFPNDSLDTLSPFQRLIPVSRSFVQMQILNPDLTQIRNEISTKKRQGECSLELSFLEAAQRLLEDQKRLLVSVTEAVSPTIDNCSSGEFYYFHQSKDGLNVFLHPLCMKILKFHFGSYESIPEDLSLPIVQLERLIVTSGNRRRFKYLDHLSSGTQIILVEVDLRGVVSGSTLNFHVKELTSRKDIRDQKFASESRKTMKSDSILDEWKRMEDDFYFTTQGSAAMDIKIPESVNLNDLDDESSFPLPSSFNTNANASPGSLLFSTPPAFKRSPMLVSNRFSDAAASPPSFSALAHSLNYPFNYNLSFTIDGSSSSVMKGTTSSYASISESTSAIASGIDIVNTTTTTSSNNITSTSNTTGNSTSSSPPSSSGKKKFVLFSSGLNIKR